MLIYKGIKFDDWVDNKDNYSEEDGLDGYWCEICNRCYKEFADKLYEKVVKGAACGTCSVYGCDREADHYVDFERNEVKITEVA